MLVWKGFRHLFGKCWPNQGSFQHRFVWRWIHRSFWRLIPTILWLSRVTFLLTMIKYSLTKRLTDALILQSWELIQRILLVSNWNLCQHTGVWILLRSIGKWSLHGEVKEIVLSFWGGVLSKESFHSTFVAIKFIIFLY